MCAWVSEKVKGKCFQKSYYFHRENKIYYYTIDCVIKNVVSRIVHWGILVRYGRSLDLERGKSSHWSHAEILSNDHFEVFKHENESLALSGCLILPQSSF